MGIQAFRPELAAEAFYERIVGRLAREKPLLMILVIEDGYTLPLTIRDAFVRAGEPKKLVELSGGHYDVYDGPQARPAADAAIDWFVAHLRREARVRWPGARMRLG